MKRMRTTDTVVIMGGGPAGLTAALELIRSGRRNVVVIELESQVGGISRTVRYNGNRMDIGGHRFFSKSDAVMDWWQRILPLEGTSTPEKDDDVLLVRSRLSRIFYLRKFFDYPISLRWATLRNLGASRVFSMGLDYLKSVLFPIRPEKSLEDFFINRFGRKLYETFFRDYTQKVWGVPCGEISADWGAQRIKNLSIFRVLRHAVMRQLKNSAGVRQKGTDTSLIEQFLYPKYGPGQLWETAARKIREAGGQVLLRHQVTGIAMTDGVVSGVHVRNIDTGKTTLIPCSAAVSSLPVKELVAMLDAAPPPVREISNGLVYRDFITVGLLCRGLSIDGEGNAGGSRAVIKDNWIYVQEPDVFLGRIQIFNNWSPWLVRDPATVWLGLEYFATEGDALWEMPDKDFIDMSVNELISLGFIRKEDVLDATILRVKKAYPAYFGSYPRMAIVREYLNSIPNLYPVGRNGMHRYNNMDHSMLSAMRAVACILDPTLDKTTIWKINEDQTYHESKENFRKK